MRCSVLAGNYTSFRSLLFCFMLVSASSFIINQLYPSRRPAVHGVTAWLSRSVSSTHQYHHRRSSIALLSTSAMTNQQESHEKVRARKVSPDQLQECGARLQNGDLVAFPTETVYGLGCHALDPKAVAKVFQAKERPLTDPLIVHVTKTSNAQQLWAADVYSTEGRALQILCNAFWPGPLTLVAKANSQVPPLLMANTGFVACRSPSLDLARRLIDAAQVPIAAPSANKFGHVSPTRAQHVWDDLQYEDVWIVDDGPSSSSSSSVCNVGVESTVAKMEFDTDGQVGTITLLRQGAVSGADLETCLRDAGLGDTVTVVAQTQTASNETVPTVSPGQCYRHYSPDIPSYMLSCQFQQDITNPVYLSTTVIIDFNQQLRSFKGHSLAYRDLSASGTSSEAAQSLFETLRWAEQVEDATRIVFPEIQEKNGADALTLALKDRLTRAASGVVIDCLGKSVEP